VAPQIVTRYASIAAASLAGLVLLGLATFGDRAQTHVGTFRASGLMLAPPDQIHSVELVNHYGRSQFVRRNGKWQTGSGAGIRDFDAKVENALGLLHNAAPERTLPEERPEYRTFGLDPPFVVVTVKGKDTLSVAFGIQNPLGSARYAQVLGRPEVILVPKYVADAWENLAPSPR